MNQNPHEHEPHRPDHEVVAAPAADHPKSDSTDSRTVHLDAPGQEHGEIGNVSAVREGIQRHGEAFLAYLMLDGVEQRAPDIVQQFEDTYNGYYPTRQSFIEEEIAFNNWEGNTGGWLERLGLPADAVTWNFDVMWAHLNEVYRTTERLGGVYVFTR